MEKMYVLWGEDSGNRSRVNWRCPNLRDLGFYPPSCLTPSSVRPNNTSLKHTHEATVVSLRLEDYPTNIMTTPPVVFICHGENKIQEHQRIAGYEIAKLTKGGQGSRKNNKASLCKLGLGPNKCLLGASSKVSLPCTQQTSKLYEQLLTYVFLHLILIEWIMVKNTF